MTHSSARVGSRRLARSTSGLGLGLALAVGLGIFPAAGTASAHSTSARTYSAAPAPSSNGSSPTIRQGSRGSAVADLQGRLGITADGVFGPNTRGSVVSFQRGARLAADGVVGPNTWSALRGGARPAQATASRSTQRTAPPAASSSFGDRAIAEARRHVGKPYVYGAAGPNSFDCSGYVQYVMKQLGVSLPHNAAAIYNSVPHIDKSQIRRGDLAFIRTDGRISHVGIYDGDGYWYVARRSGTTITRQKIWTSNFLAGRIS